MKKLICIFIIVSVFFVACNTQSNEPIKVKSEVMDTVRQYDLNGNYVKDTLIPRETMTK